VKFFKLIRKVVPSISRLTFNPFFKLLLNAGALPQILIFPEFRRLPPNHMRVRIGVGSKLFNNEIRYLTDCVPFWTDALLHDYVSADATIVDLGVGCGRYAHFWRDYDFFESKFVGKYIGIDIDKEMLDWMRRSYDSRFRFHYSSDVSISYHVEGKPGDLFRIPEPDGAVDFIFSRSLFTHLLERELENYLRESFRLLKPGGYASHSVFCTDHPPPTYGDRHTFSHTVGNARIESLAQPEAAVAYSEEFLNSLAKRVGFDTSEIRYRRDLWQPILICRKGL
jgi:SAM-dependent methyltransferase